MLLDLHRVDACDRFLEPHQRSGIGGRIREDVKHAALLIQCCDLHGGTDPCRDPQEVFQCDLVLRALQLEGRPAG